MAKQYELTIKANYLPGWGTYEGLREIIQNARDAEVQYGAPMSVKFVERVRDGEKVGAVVIKNDNTTIPKEALLVGHTSKENDSRLIGKFGEGLKYGILALLRIGMEVKIRNGSEVWNPVITNSKTFNASVLAVNVSDGKANENRVQFEIIGITKADWDNIESKLLFLGNYPEHVSCIDGNVLTDNFYKGMVFVKGMFVAKNDSLSFGYDFEDADIDRDRRMVNSLTEKTSDLLCQAINKGSLVDSVYKLLEDGSDEVNYVNHWRLCDDAKDRLVAFFQKQNPGAIPVESIEQASELKTYGKVGVRVNWNMRGILESKIGSAGHHLVSLRKSEAKVWDFDELEIQERDNLRKCVVLVSKALTKIGDEPLKISSVLVVDFNKPDLLGTFSTNSKEIRLARSILKNIGRTLYTLIHEAAHIHGDDGFITHEAAIGKLSEEIFNEFV